MKKMIFLLSILSISFTSVHGMSEDQKLELWKRYLNSQSELDEEMSDLRNSMENEFGILKWPWDKIKRKSHENPDEI